MVDLGVMQREYERANKLWEKRAARADSLATQHAKAAKDAKDQWQLVCSARNDLINASNALVNK